MRYGTWNVYGSNNVNPYKYHNKLKILFLNFQLLRKKESD